MNTRKRFASLLALAAALVAAGCGGGGSGNQMYTPPTATPTPVTESFTAWSKNGVFTQPEDATPIAMDTLVFNFDGDENPNAYADLLPTT